MAGKPRLPAGLISAAIVAVLAVLLLLKLWFWAVGGAILLAAFIGWRFHSNERSERSQGLAAALSVLVLLFGAYWYMIERPGAAKLNLLLTGQGFRAPGGALVFLAVDVQNVGNTPVSFAGEPEPARPAPAAAGPVGPPPDVDCLAESGEAMAAATQASVMKIRIGKVMPLTAPMKERLACATQASPADGPVPLARADLWPPVARVDQILIAKIEAGESEKYYYRLIVPCERGLVLAASARIPKRGTITDAFIQEEPAGQVWIAQTLIDLVQVCGK
jgi:hypothetical protein